MPPLPDSTSGWSRNLNGMTPSSQPIGKELHLMIFTGKVYDPHLADSPKVGNFSFLSMLTTGPQHCTSQRATQNKTTVSTGSHCFTCGAWQEDTDHILCCPSDHWAASRDKAKTQLLDHLTKYYTPVPLAQVIMAALDQWLANLPPALVPHLPTGPGKSNQLLHKLISNTFNKQIDIGWGHFLWGHLLLHWKKCIAEYYKVRQPGDTYNPTLWITKTEDGLHEMVNCIPRTMTNSKQLH
jgi:hypothetical protein